MTIHTTMFYIALTDTTDFGSTTDKQNALRRDCNGKCIEQIESHYLELVVDVYSYLQ